MGLMDLFKKSGQGAINKHAKRVANKMAQAPDRWDSIQALAKDGSEEAIDALLVRFTYTCDPSITDQEEKDAAFELVVAAKEKAIAPVTRFLAKANSISWPMKLLEKLLSEADVVQALIDILSKMDTEYERDPLRKQQVLAELSRYQHPAIITEAMRFVEDMNEEVRFFAVAAVMGQNEREQARETLLQMLEKEESMRVKARLLELFAQYQWSLGTKAASFRKNMPGGFSLDGRGVPVPPA